MAEDLLGRGLVEFSARDRGMLDLMRKAQGEAKSLASTFEQMAVRVRTSTNAVGSNLDSVSSKAEAMVRSVGGAMGGVASATSRTADSAIGATAKLDKMFEEAEKGTKDLEDMASGVASAGTAASAAVGPLALLGTVVGGILVTAAVNQWRDYQLELERLADRASKAQEALRDLGRANVLVAGADTAPELIRGVAAQIDAARKAADAEAARITLQGGQRSAYDPAAVRAREAQVAGVRQADIAIERLRRQSADAVNAAVGNTASSEQVRDAIRAVEQYRQAVSALSEDESFLALYGLKRPNFRPDVEIGRLTTLLADYRNRLQETVERERELEERKRKQAEHAKELAEQTKRWGQYLTGAVKDGLDRFHAFVDTVNRTKNIRDDIDVLRLRAQGKDDEADKLARRQKFDELRRKAANDAERRLLDEQEALENQVDDRRARKPTKELPGGRLVGTIEATRQLQRDIFSGTKVDDVQRQTATNTKRSADKATEQAKTSQEMAKTLEKIHNALAGGSQAVLA